MCSSDLDSANLSYIEKLHDAVACIIDHPIFSGIVAADPMHITSDDANSSSQAAFDSRSFTNAMKSSHKSYTAGINAFWIDMLWSATPGVPVRMSGIQQMASTTFKFPTKLPPVHIAIQSVDSNVLVQKGSLLRVSPEELTSAAVFAIARDIKNNESDEVRLSWKSVVLDTTAVFHLLPTSSDRYWYALQQRETISTIHKAAYRTALQRVYEVSRLMKKMKETLPASEVTAASIAQAYNDNLESAPGSTSKVTLNFIDCSVTISNRLLCNPEIVYCLQDLEESSTCSENTNPLDSVTKLQEIINKCKSNTANLTWVIQGFWYTIRHGRMNQLSVNDIRGTAATGNRGLVDLLVYKMQMRSVMLSEYDWPESAQWVQTQVSEASASFKAWYEHEQSHNKSWRAGRELHENKWLTFFGDVVFGATFDSSLKLAIKASKTPSEALHGPVLQDVLDELTDKRKIYRALMNYYECKCHHVFLFACKVSVVDWLTDCNVRFDY